jgi:putative transposase
MAVSPQILENCGYEDHTITDEQIIGFLKQAEAGMSIKELCRSGGFSQSTFYKWRSKFGGMEASDASRLRDLESENTKLKKLLALQAKNVK